MTEHTKTPWIMVVDDDDFDQTIRITTVGRGDTFVPIATIEWGFVDEVEKEQRANAAFIVRACNAHDELVAALRGMVEAYTSLANGGDFGGRQDPEFWTPEKDAVVIAARAALSRAGVA